MTLKLKIILVVAALTALPVSASATGVIKGKITDPEGIPVRDVKITLVDPARGQTYVLKTNNKGEYYQIGINPAEYRMRIEKDGFLPLEGKFFISPEEENVYNAVLAPTEKPPLKPAWEDANVRANGLYREGKFAEALDIYKGILARDGALAAIHFDAGNCLFHMGQYGESVTAFREAIRLKTDFFEAYTNLANAYGKLKKFDEGLSFFEDALRAYPESPAILSSAGLLYLNAGRSDGAIACLEKAASLDPNAAVHFYSLGIAYTQKGDLGKAVECYEKFLALNKDGGENERVKTIVEQLKKALEKR
jgi:tetratricopeptide (TPR) repeat protein